MDPQRFYGIRNSSSNHRRYNLTSVPDSSDDEILSDEDTGVRPKPFEEVFIPDSDDDEEYLDYENLCENEENYEPAMEVELLHEPSTSKSTSEEKKKCDVLVWSDNGIEYEESQTTFLGCTDLPDNIMMLETPIDFFKFLFPSSIISLIETESNLYADQKTKGNFNEVTDEDIRKFIGIVMYMSIVRLPTIRHYWMQGTCIEQVASVMTCNKFEEIKRFLHFFDKDKELKSEDPNFDKLQKIRPFLEIVRERLLLVPKEEYLAIDEQMIPTKARTSGIRQYNAKKPHKWGYLNYVLSGVSGFSYDFEIFTGKHPGPPEDCPDLGVPGNVVQRLLKTVSPNLNFKLFIDNWYTGLPLMANLHNKGILPLGTIQINRAKNISLDKKFLMKQTRGHCVEKSTEVDGVQLSVTSWVDNKVVSLCSSYVGKEPMTNVKRFVKKEKKRIDVPCPKAVSIYNKFMGGVDILDSMLGFYRIKIRSKKWYHRLFFHFIDLTCVNSWLLWRRCMSQKGLQTYMPLLDFKLYLAEVLMKEGNRVFTPTTRGRPKNDVVESIKQGKKRRRRLELPAREVAEDGMNHWPECVSDRQRCVLCSQNRTQIICLKCNLYLCLNKDRNYFKAFHT